MKMTKKILFGLLFLAGMGMGTGVASAQLKTAYFMEGSIPRYEMNAALSPLDGYVNVIPFSNMQFSVNNNFISVRNFLYPDKEKGSGHVTFMHNSVGTKEFLRNIPEQPNFGVDFKYGLVSFGNYHKRHGYFWSFDWNIRAMGDVTLSKDMFRAIKDLRNGNYDLGKTSVSAMAYSEFSYGFTMPVGWQNLVVGGRLKFLLGFAHTQMNFNKATISIGDDEITALMNGTAQASVLGSDQSSLGSVGQAIPFGDIFDFSNFANNAVKGYGAAIDFGAEASFFDKHLKVSLGVNDLGFIYWNKGIQGKLDDVLFEYRGYNTDMGEFDIKSQTDFAIRKTDKSGYSKRLATTLNIGAEWSFGAKHWASLGVLSHTKFWNKAAHSELTFIGTLRAGRWFSWALSHTFLQENRLGIFGTAFNFHPRGVNIFFGMDYIPTTWGHIDDIPVPTTAKAFNLYMGFSFTPGGRSKGW